jgi:hypothetical protein
MGEMEETDGFVDYRKAEGYEGIDGTGDEAVKQ